MALGEHNISRSWILLPWKRKAGFSHETVVQPTRRAQKLRGLARVIMSMARAQL
jgi:hypothetical protein